MFSDPHIMRCFGAISGTYVTGRHFQQSTQHTTTDCRLNFYYMRHKRGIDAMKDPQIIAHRCDMIFFQPAIIRIDLCILATLLI